MSDSKYNASFCYEHVCHGDELSFLFESRWIRYWTNFAKTEDPNEPLRVSISWPKIRNGYETYMYFQDPLQIRENYLKDFF